MTQDLWPELFKNLKFLIDFNKKIIMAEGGLPPDAPRGLPPGCAMYYDVAARFDSRHARKLIKESTALIQKFVQAFGMGRDHPDQEFKVQANDLRSQLTVQKLAISEICDKFTIIADRDSLISIIGRMQMSLDSHPPFEFPPVIEIDPQIAGTFLNRINRDAGPVLPPFPLDLRVAPLNRISLLETTPPVVGPLPPREPFIGPLPPPLLFAPARPTAPPALPAPPTRPALPAPETSSTAPIATTPAAAGTAPQPQLALIAFSETSRAPSVIDDETTRERAPPEGNNSAGRREIPSRSNATSLVSGMTDHTSLVSSSTASNRTNFDQPAMDESPPATANAGNVTSTLRVRYDSIHRKKGRLERRVQRYEEEMTRISEQAHNTSLQSIGRHVNAAVGELSDLLQHPLGGAALAPVGPTRTESWLDTQNDPNQAAVRPTDSISSCSRNTDRNDRPPRSRSSRHDRNQSSNPSIPIDQNNQTQVGHSGNQFITPVIRQDDTPQSQFNHDPDQTYPAPTQGQNQNIQTSALNQIRTGQPEQVRSGRVRSGQVGSTRSSFIRFEQLNHHG